MSNLDMGVMPEFTQITKIGLEYVCTYPIAGSSPEDNYSFKGKTADEALSLAVNHFESGFYVIGKEQERRFRLGQPYPVTNIREKEES